MNRNLIGRSRRKWIGSRSRNRKRWIGLGNRKRRKIVKGKKKKKGLERNIRNWWRKKKEGNSSISRRWWSNRNRKKRKEREGNKKKGRKQKGLEKVLLNLLILKWRWEMSSKMGLYYLMKHCISKWTCHIN